MNYLSAKIRIIDILHFVIFKLTLTAIMSLNNMKTNIPNEDIVNVLQSIWLAACSIITMI